MKEKLSRRSFITSSAVTGLTASATMNAKSYSRIQGANDRINIGFLGCGGRSRGHRRMVQGSLEDKNLGVVAVCDLWTVNREKAAADCKEKFGVDVQQFKYSEKMLEMADLDAVMIATGDHQHGRILAQVVEAGKDCYVEKPMALDVEEAKLARKAVLNSQQVVQNGSQWLSDPYHRKVREIIRSGKLGQITKIEQVWNDNNHRWHDPNDPDVAAVREEDTDWERWLLGKPYRPFDPWAYFEFRIFKDFSGGITSQWFSHGLGIVQFFMDVTVPDTMVASGGIFGWDDIRQNPDTFQCLGTFEDIQLLHSYSSSYANRFGDYTCIRGKEASLYSQGGEGSPRWFLIPEVPRDGRHFYGGFEEAIAKGEAELVTIEGNDQLAPTWQSDDSKPHLDNWIDCMRSRNLMPHGHIHTGFWHSVGSTMATRAYREGRKLCWDRQKEEIIDAL
ncbi:MAG: Gfo/Idh/MocA family oxidoreductase [Acidobacteriota bacterium]|nr:MAG: Gfo/Idh/MocA family oxidoreductase [Acidobacteriota bacterium]